jgi:hypothetical protein
MGTEADQMIAPADLLQLPGMPSALSRCSHALAQASGRLLVWSNQCPRTVPKIDNGRRLGQRVVRIDHSLDPTAQSRVEVLQPKRRRIEIGLLAERDENRQVGDRVDLLAKHIVAPLADLACGQPPPTTQA